MQSRTRSRGQRRHHRGGLRYYRSVVGDRTPAELQETYVRGGAALIEYLESDEHFGFKILPWPDYYSSAVGARNDGMRHIVSKAVPDNRLGRFQGLVRGPLDHERLGAPQPDLLTGGRALIGRFLWAMADNPAVAAHLNTSLVELIVETAASAAPWWRPTARGG